MIKIYLVTFLNIIACCLQAQNTNPVILWQKHFGGTRDDKAYAVTKTSDGGAIVVGSSKSNDVHVSGHHGSLDSTDAWVIKISSKGNLEWKRSYGGTRDDVFKGIIRTFDGNYLCLGTTQSNDGDVSGLHGNANDLWLVKIDGNGTILWQRCFGGSLTELPGNLRENQDHTLYLIGTTNSNDGDVSGNHSFNKDIWVLKLNESGQIIWQRCFGGWHDDEGYDIAESYGRHFLINAVVNSSDGDFGYDNSLGIRGYTIKIDTGTKAMLWKLPRTNGRPLQLVKDSNSMAVTIAYDVRACTYPNFNNGIEQSVFVDYEQTGNDNLVPFTQLFQLKQFCPPSISPIGYKIQSPSSTATVNRSLFFQVCAATSDASAIDSGYNGGASDGFVYGYSPGEEFFKKFIGGSGTDELLSIAPVNTEEFFVVGFSNSLDAGTQHIGGYDFMVVKMGNGNYIKGTAFADHNKNGVKDTGEPFVDTLCVESHQGEDTIRGIISNYKFLNIVGQGSYSTRLVTSLPYYRPVPDSIVSTFNGYSNTDSISFALQPIPGKRDYKVDYIKCLNQLRTGGNVRYLVSFSNVGTDTLLNAGVQFIKDNRIHFLSSSIAQQSVNGDTIYFVINRLEPRDSIAFTLDFQIGSPPLIHHSDNILNVVRIDTVGDENGNNNSLAFTQAVTGPYPQNVKYEDKAGLFYKRDYDNLNYVYYTIAFQNRTGATVQHITVKDTLSDLFDHSSFQMIGSSHPYQLSVENGKYLTWTFNNINMHDSSYYEYYSQGTIDFRIRPVRNLRVLDSITNRAYVSFAFQPYLATNSAKTIIVYDTSTVCKGGITVVSAKPLQSKYQWQVLDSSGYRNLRDDSIYQGTTTRRLQIKTMSSSMTGLTYRCAYSSAPITKYTQPYTLRFKNTWIGNNSISWNDPLNWSCGSVPDLYTDVVINPGTLFNVTIDSDITIRSLTLNTGAVVNVAPGVTITVTN